MADAVVDTNQVEMAEEDDEVMETPVVADIPANHTLYISNINEKIKIEKLKKDLYDMFNQFGKILEIICTKTYRLRGQAWIVFDDIASATAALRQMNGFEYSGKPFRVQYARSKSDTIQIREGASIDKSIRKEQRQKRFDEDEQERKKKKKQRVVSHKSLAGSGIAMSVIALQPTHRQEPPNNILFVENLPEQATGAMLEKLFSQFPGYKESRLVQGKGIAFVEYTTDVEASVALQTVQGFKMTHENALAISFAKK